MPFEKCNEIAKPEARIGRRRANLRDWHGPTAREALADSATRQVGLKSNTPPRSPRALLAHELDQHRDDDREVERRMTTHPATCTKSAGAHGEVCGGGDPPPCTAKATNSLPPFPQGGKTKTAACPGCAESHAEHGSFPSIPPDIANFWG